MGADSRVSGWMRIAERLLFVIAAVALVWYAGVHVVASREQAALSDELDRGRTKLDSGRTGLDPGRKTATTPSGLIGRIDVPRLKLSALAREGVDTETLRSAAGHVPGTALPGEMGNAAFAAHRDTFFRPLRSVRLGDAITIATPEGDFRYVVSGTRVVDPSDVSVLRPTGEPTLTLVTCYPFNYIGSAPQRFIVSARLVPSKPPL